MLIFNQVPDFDTLLKYNPEVKAFLWDMDGTIMRTEWLHAKALGLQLEDLHQIKLHDNELEMLCTGRTDHQIYELIQKEYKLTLHKIEDIIAQKNKLVEDLVLKTDPNSIIDTNILKLIQKIHTSGYKQAVVTSAEKDITHFMFNALKLDPYYHLKITREDTHKNKPHPMPYLHAMNLLNVNPNETIIFEDSVTGMTAAKSSGGFCVKADWYLSVKA
jgi:beta-phosphoglucomutase